MEILKVLTICSVVFYVVGTVIAVPTAQIDNSRITGQTVTFSGIQVQQYLGIPFAEPPLGPLRFQKPQPIQNYPSEFEALTNPPACLQYTTQPYPWYINIPDKSEDCLYLNIWTPANANSEDKKAVMYWIYGTGYRYGSMSDPLYNGTYLASLGDIIVVTVNYRVGYFGFLTSNSPDAPGNVGIWDILEGLKWVNKHIEAFGGDVSRITIAGESSGAVIVGLLSISPLAKGLYARQIIQSASPVYRRGDNKTRNFALSQQMAKYVGCANDSYSIGAYPKEVVQCLRGIGAEELSKVDYELAPKSAYHLIPEYGDELLVDNPRVSVINGDFRCSNLLIGTNNDEGSNSMTSFGYQDIFGFFGEKSPHVNRSLGADLIRTSATIFPDPEAIVSYYLPKDIDDTYYSIRSQAYTAIGDLGLICPTVYYAEKCAEQGKDVYYYFFSHRPSNSLWTPWMGVTHFDEVQFVFGRPIISSDYEIKENFLSRKVIDVWSSFVKNGKPGIPWPLYSKDDHKYKVIGALSDGDETNGPHGKNCEFLKPFFGL